jgi:DNA-binding PadR family transcriptional regulator
MAVLRSVNATNKIHGITIKEIQNYEKLSKCNTLYKKVKALESVGFINEGVMAGRAKTYYLTSLGIAELPEKSERGTK